MADIFPAPELVLYLMESRLPLVSRWWPQQNCLASNDESATWRQDGQEFFQRVATLPGAFVAAPDVYPAPCMTRDRQQVDAEA
ncbi:hypothetical protein [Sinorhizobium sp. A49]|uniref:hypothetical protein n=1 Tax=Sinorhizobium sp. A49 TaxID=1945861 RepID=UPI000984B954|nr:hypothetical protein [Sinorhizobium sp. A49]OOG68982.1 hypothetical protein B0E45_15935 [Sinorhizobium sp. A49]